MAGARGKTQAYGSAGWIQSERQQIEQFVGQENEDFSYSVRNELEWLQAHVGEVFATNNVNFADVFKTPGKLRGKTPRTARKQNIAGPRQPLTDIFAPNVPAPQSAQKTAFFDKVAHFRIAEDAENQPPAHRPSSRGKSPQRIGKNINTDSGYHGMTEDEMDVDSKTETATQSSQQSEVQKVPLRENQPPRQRQNAGSAGVSSDDSFLSAREDLTSRHASKAQLVHETGDEEVAEEGQMEVDAETAENAEADVHGENVEVFGSEPDQDMDDVESRSQSDASSPEKPLQRKSSFTFTALPAREPLTATKSMGARNSQIEARNSTLGRSFGAKSFGASNNEDDYAESTSEETKAHNKTSTQLLQERINMLGKTKEPRTSKSLHQTILGGQTAYPQLPREPAKSTTPADDSDDDWIAPSKPVHDKSTEEQVPQKEPSLIRPAMHQKSISTTQIPSPARPEMATEARHAKATSVSIPNFAYATAEIQSTTPAGSPVAKKSHDGPLSASKSKLYSVLKSAKNIFASSASASAAAKLEAHNNSPSRSPRRDVSDESKTAAVFNMPGALYSERQLPPSPSRTKSVISLVSTSPSRKTRSSNESDKKREKELKAQQKAADDLEKAREKERQKAAKQQEEKQKAEQAEAAKKQKQAQKALPERPTTAGSDGARDSEMPPPPPPKTMLPPGKLRAPGRIAKPGQSASKPAPVLIRVGSQRLHHPATSSLSKSQHENSGPPVPPKQPAGRVASAQGNMRSSTAPQNSRLKALESAARKKEADEKAAQKKAEQKRELERKRAAKVEEERRAEEERKAAEQQRQQEAKAAAQRQAEKQAADARRREEQRLEQQRQQEEAQKARAAHDLAEAIKRERAQQQAAQPRNDVGGTLRQLAKNTVPEQPATRPPLHPNPAKPAKRVWVPEEDDPSKPQTYQPQRPGVQRGPASFQQSQNDAKRRRTNEEEKPEEGNSVMAPPKRPSNMRKVSRTVKTLLRREADLDQESTLNKFPHGYTHAPPPVNHHPSMFKATVTAQHQLQHPNKPSMPSHPSQMAQISNTRIPFGENVNPPGQASHHPQAKQYAGHENLQPGTAQQNKFKTPARPAQMPKSAKSSPLYPNGDNIELPDIETDSEEEDSDDDNTGFRAPSWVASPALRELLTQQQLVDPETVFGPIAELKMEEVFRNGKNAERLKKFRDRSSSAMWVQTGDAITSAEKRRDMEVRERVAREGGWRYAPGS
ncbi:uncharacterized protein LTR77_000997 [Saxophila tyrrhenica]|uniref:Inner centromere protein ARK-binding domain-containing protein n=1 Tax=Saxophila tyrrhenica TaxID=1690608 RepID=A0AAV9PSQ2_9PEZI|nr:hypothetical protein LTR77_000997 [Saxophila tyrrhenica]